MASLSYPPLVIQTPTSRPRRTPRSTALPRAQPPFLLTAMATSDASSSSSSSDRTTKLVTFLGKGGSGKTTSAVFAARHYAMAGLKTCLVIHTQDPTAEFLLDCKIGSSAVACSGNLSALRFETTKMLLEPLDRLKQADARLNMTQGVLEKIVGEELGVLPGMDSIFSAYSLERLTGIFGTVAKQNQNKENFDIVVFDGTSSDELLRMISAASKARLYLKYLRNLAEKTDLGRLAGPSLLRLADEAIDINRNLSLSSGQISAEIWDSLENMLERGSLALTDPQKFGCFLVMDPQNPLSVNSALRYWGCAIQANAHVSGALGFATPLLNAASTERVKETFTPLPFGLAPNLPFDSVVDWKSTLVDSVNSDARNLLMTVVKGSGTSVLPVQFDAAKKTVTLLMPGFDKSEIKLYQFRGGSELLVEAGDQRRVIRLPSEIQGKVGGAKFIHRNLVITMR